MPRPFLLTGILQIQVPTLGQIKKDIQTELNSISVKVKLRSPEAQAINTVRKNIQEKLNKVRVQAKLDAPSNTNINSVATQINRKLGQSTAINLKVRGQQSLSSANKSVNQTSSSLKHAANSVEDFGVKSALAFKRFAAFAVSAGGAFLLISAIRKGVTDAIEFQNTMVKISQVTGGTLDSVRGLSDEITRLATTFGVSSKELADASLVLAQAGFTANDTKKALATLAKTDLAPTFDSIKDTTEGIIAAMNQFGFSIDDLDARFGSINKVAGAFAVESGDLITAFRKAGGAFRAAGGDLNDLLALFTSVRATTRQSADTIANGFNTIFARLQRVSTSDFLSGFGIQLRDANGQFIGARESIEQLSIALQNIPSSDPRFSRIVEEIGGFRQLKIVIPLLKQYQVTRQALNIAQRGATSLDQDQARSQESLSRQIARVREEFTALLRKVSEGGTFRTLLDLTLQLTKSVIKLVDALERVGPAIAVLGILPTGRLLSKFGKGFTGKGLASGGLVGGSGNSDTVSAMLTPGEFVLNKKATQRIGVDRLKELNSKKFNKGGPVGYAGGGLVKSNTGGLLGAGAILLGAQSLARSLGVAGDTLDNFTTNLISGVAQFLIFSNLLSSTSKTQKLTNDVAEQFKNKISTITSEASRLESQQGFALNKSQAISFSNRSNTVQKENDALQLVITRMDRLQTGTAIAGAGLSVLGGSLKDFALDLKTFGKGIGGKTAAFIGGGLATAGTTAQIGLGAGQFTGAGLGAIKGGVGGAITGGSKGGFIGLGAGLLIGGVTGSVQSLKEFNEKLDRVDFEEFSDKFSKMLDKVGRDQISARTVSGSLGGSANDLVNRLRTTSGAARENTVATINSSLPAMEAFLVKLAEGAQTFGEFDNQGKDVVELFTRFSDISVNDFNDKIKKQIETQNKQKEITAKVNTSLEEFNLRVIDSSNIVSAFSDATNIVGDFSGGLSDLVDSINGTIGGFKSFDIKDVFEKALSGQSINNNILNRSVGNISSIFESALGNDRASALARPAIEAAGINSQLSDILLRVGTQNRLDPENSDPVNALQDELEKLTKNKEVINALTGGAGRADKFFERIFSDRPGLVKELAGATEPFIEVFKDAAPLIQNRMNQFSEQLALRRKLEQESAAIADKSIDIERKSLEVFSGISGKDTPINGLVGLESKRFSNLFSSKLNVSTDPNTLGDSLDKSQRQLAEIVDKLRLAQGGNVTNLENSRDAIVRTIEETTNALKFLADQSRKAGDIESEIAKERDRRQTKFNFAKDFLFGDNESRRNSVRGLALANIVAKTGNINSIPSSRRQEAGQALEQFADVPIFGGKKGREVQEQLLKNAGLGGANVPVGKEASLVEQLKSVFEDMGKANNILARNTESSIDTFGKTIAQQNASFLSELKTILLEGESRRTQTRLGLEQSNLAGLQNKQGLLDKLGGITGKPVTSDSLRDLVGGSSSLIKFNELHRQQQSLKNLFQRIGPGIGGDLGGAGITEILGQDPEKFLNSKLFKDTGLNRHDISKQFSDNRSSISSIGLKDPEVLGSILITEIQKSLEKFNEPTSELNRLSASLEPLGDNFRVLAARSAEISDIINKLSAFRNVDGLSVELDASKFKIDALTQSLQALNQVLPRSPVVAQRPVTRAFGGPIGGSGTRDTVPAMLTPGEFVIRREAVNSIGMDNLFALNSQGFAGGGLVHNILKKSKKTKKGLDSSSLKKAGIAPGSRLGAFAKESLTNEQITDLGPQGKKELGRQFRATQKTERENRRREILDARLSGQQQKPAPRFGQLNRPVTSPTTGEFLLTPRDRALLSGSDDRGQAEFYDAFNGLNAVIRNPGVTDFNVFLQATSKLDAIKKKLSKGISDRIQTKSLDAKINPRLPGTVNVTRRRSKDRPTSLAAITATSTPISSLFDRANLPGVGKITAGGSPRALRAGSSSRLIQSQVGEELAARTNRIKTGTQRVEEQPFRATTSLDIQLKRSQNNIALDTQRQILKINRSFQTEKIKEKLLRDNAAGGNQEAIKEIERRNRRLRGGFNKGGPVGFQTGGSVGGGSGLNISSESIDKFNDVVNAFSKVSDTLIKSLSTLTINFEHTVNHTGQLNIIGALEASQAISDAIIKRVVPLVDQRISQIEHDGSGKHRVRGR